MLLKGTRALTYSAALVALGVIMILVSTYTPLGRRVLLLTSGVPVLLAGEIAGKKGAAGVYLLTAVIALVMVQPVRGVAYLLVTGGVPLVISLGTVPLIVQAGITAVLSIGYFMAAELLFALPLSDSYQRILALAPWLEPYAGFIMLMLLVVGCFGYPLGMRVLKNQLENHWVFRQLFKP